MKGKRYVFIDHKQTNKMCLMYLTGKLGEDSCG